RAGGRLQQTQLLVQMDRPHRLAGESGQVADADHASCVARALDGVIHGLNSYPYAWVRFGPKRTGSNRDMQGNQEAGVGPGLQAVGLRPLSSKAAPARIATPEIQGGIVISF